VRVRIDVPPERIGELNETDIQRSVESAYYVRVLRAHDSRTAAVTLGCGRVPRLQRAGPIEPCRLLEHQKVNATPRTLVRFAHTLMEEDGSWELGVGDGPLRITWEDSAPAAAPNPNSASEASILPTPS